MHFTALLYWVLALHLTARCSALQCTADQRTRLYYTPLHCAATSRQSALHRTMNFTAPLNSVYPYFTVPCISLHPALHCTLHFTAPYTALHFALHCMLHFTEHYLQHYTSMLSTALKSSPLHFTTLPCAKGTKIHRNSMQGEVLYTSPYFTASLCLHWDLAALRLSCTVISLDPSILRFPAL